MLLDVIPRLISWTVTSFLCHFFAKKAITALEYKMFGSILVSFCQLWFCFEAIDGSTASRLQKMAHAVATLTTNTAMAVLPASSTMVVKMLEPLTTAALKRFTQGVSVPTFTLVSLPLIVTGVTLFVGNPFETMLYTNSLLLVLTSNICFGIRNITSSNQIKNQHLSLKRRDGGGGAMGPLGV